MFVGLDWFALKCADKGHQIEREKERCTQKREGVSVFK